jgi:hypothetical protein
MPSGRFVRSALLVVFGVTASIAAFPGSAASALPTSTSVPAPRTTTTTTTTTTVRPLTVIELVPPTTVVLATPQSAASTGATILPAPDPPTPAATGRTALPRARAALPHTL